MLIDGFLDDTVELGDLSTLLANDVLSLALLLGLLLVLLHERLKLLGLQTVLMMLGRESLVLGIDLILELADLVLCDTELLAKLNDLVVSDDQVLTVEVTVRTYDFVQVLLLLELAFELDVLLLQLSDQVALELDFFNHLHQVGISLVGRLSLLFLLCLNLSDRLDQALDVVLVAVVLLLKGVDDLVLAGEGLPVLVVVLLHLEEGRLEHVSITLEFHDARLLVIRLLLEPVEVTEQIVHQGLGFLFLPNGLALLCRQALLVVFEPRAVLLHLRHPLFILLARLLVGVECKLRLLLFPIEVTVLLLQSAKLALKLLDMGLVLTVLTLPLRAGLIQVQLLTIELIVLLLKIIDGSVQVGDLLVELGLLRFKRVGLALLVLLCPHQRVDLDQVLLVLLLQRLELGLLRVEADLKQVGFLLDLLLSLFDVSELLCLGGKLLLELLFLVDHLLHVVVSADG